MEIKRCKTLTEAWGEPVIEIRDLGGDFLLSITFGDDDSSYLDGPFPSAEVAENEGIARAEQRGLSTLNIVHTRS